MLAILLLATLLDSRNATTEGVLSGASAPAPPQWTRSIEIIDDSDQKAIVWWDGDHFIATHPVLVYRVDTNIVSGARVITLATGIPARRRAVGFPTPPVTSTPHSVTLAPSKDNTLFQTSDGSLSNGAGSHLFTGTTGQGLARRALLAFDLASQIPPGSTITKVTLTMRVSKTIASDQAIALHAVTRNWSEGPSIADNPFNRDGSGAASQPGDATWIHSNFPNTKWTNAGGDFNAAVDGTATAQSLGDVTWQSSASMIARVQSWVDQPATNFGWILIGNESSNATTKRLDSREVVPAATRPALTIDYTTH